MKGFLIDKPVSLGALKVAEIEKPTVLDDGLLIRVQASSANPADLFPTTLAGYLVGGRKPQVLGIDFAGVVEAVGKTVTHFAPGDEVFGGVRGAHAEYMSVSETSAVVRKPANVSFEQAGTVAVAATTALQALRDHGHLQAGQRVLINGASGGVGTFAVQIAKALGAEVTAVCSPRNVDMVRSLGADAVIDYTREDFTRNRQKYDLLADVAGTHSLIACRRVLKREGTFVGVGVAGVQHRRAGSFRALGHLLGNRIRAIGSQRVVALFIAKLNKPDLEFLGELLADGRVVPVIDRRYDLTGVPEAFQYLEKGHARAKLAISINAYA